MLSAVFCWATPSQKLYNKRDFEAARSSEKRSLLGVNEHFPNKADAKRALLDDFLRYVVLNRQQPPIIIVVIGLHRHRSIARLAQIVGLVPPAI